MLEVLGTFVLEIMLWSEGPEAAMIVLALGYLWILPCHTNLVTAMIGISTLRYVFQQEPLCYIFVTVILKGEVNLKFSLRFFYISGY